MVEGSVRIVLSDELAEHNLECLEDLYERLAQAARLAGRDNATIARLMGIDESVVEDIFAGERDLTMSDLQEVALAVGAHLGYFVEPNADRLPSKYGAVDHKASVFMINEHWTSGAVYDVKAGVKSALKAKLTGANA